MTTSISHPHRGRQRRRVGRPPTLVPAWMSVGDARVLLVSAGQSMLPVADHDGLIGLITIEALGGQGGAAPSADDPVTSVMDWHLVQAPAGADELDTVQAYTDAARKLLCTRGDESTSVIHSRTSVRGDAEDRVQVTSAPPIALVAELPRRAAADRVLGR